MDDAPALPVLISPFGAVVTLEGLAAIPEEKIWLARQKSARTRRAYK
jgi:integrase/recombinase XerD